ncbi:MAG: MBL fold metallo-hydrolase [Phyllobacterium sp.]
MMPHAVGILATGLAALLYFCVPGAAQDQHAGETPIMSQCLAMAQALPGAAYASLTPATRAAPQFQPVSLDKQTVRLTFVDHSTFLIESPHGVTAATDYAGWAGEGVTPRIVTMNKAHPSHYTSNPDPEIEYVLRGWSPEGGPAKHAVIVDDVYIRNVTTDIRSGFDMESGMEKDGNSIFVFEIANLCIGHLGHLHHTLTDRHFAAIGRLDILMVPVDGGLTLSHSRMSEITKRLRSSIVLPMHRQGPPVQNFINMMGSEYAVERRSEPYIDVSPETLPRRPTIIVLQGM